MSVEDGSRCWLLVAFPPRDDGDVWSNRPTGSASRFQPKAQRTKTRRLGRSRRAAAGPAAATAQAALLASAAAAAAAADAAHASTRSKKRRSRLHQCTCSTCYGHNVRSAAAFPHRQQRLWWLRHSAQSRSFCLESSSFQCLPELPGLSEHQIDRVHMLDFGVWFPVRGECPRQRPPLSGHRSRPLLCAQYWAFLPTLSPGSRPAQFWHHLLTTCWRSPPWCAPQLKIA